MSPHTQNLFLAVLSAASRQLLLNKAVHVPLPIRTSLYVPDETPEYAYFITSGVASVVTSTADGGTAEVGLVGHEGFTGAFHLLGPTRVATECFVQMEGTAMRIPFPDLASIFQSSPEIHARTLELIQVQGVGLG